MDRNHDARSREAFLAAMAARMDRRRFLRHSAGAAALPWAARAAVGAAAAVPFAAFTPRAVAAAKAVLQQSGDSAEAAVAAAQEFKGTTLNVVWESALQAQDPLLFSGPKWEELTGIKINVLEVPFPELYTAQVTEHIAGTGAHDILSVVPAWQADMVAQGIVEPLDPFIDRYMNKADLDDYHPLYRDLMNFGGKIYGLMDDGDTIVLYYRRDLIEDAAHKEAFQTQYGRELAAPTTWPEYDDVQAYFTEAMAPELYGGASQRVVGGLHAWFLEEYRNKGGTFFDSETMDALVNGEAGKATLDRMVKSNETMPPDVEAYDFVKVLSDWMAGKLAMIGGTWPPIGRWSEGTTAEQLAWVPETTVAGKVGYSVMPEGHSAHNGGFMLSVAANSENKEAAYLFSQWANSPSISLQRCMLPYALRDPFRLSHYESAEYRARWDTAGEYLDTLKAAADGALLDMILPGSFDYHTAVDQAVTAAMAGTDTQEALDGLADAWNDITDRLGRDTQKAAYAQYVKLKGAYPA